MAEENKWKPHGEEEEEEEEVDEAVRKKHRLKHKDGSQPRLSRPTSPLEMLCFS